ncbi:MAG: cytochrome c3 family protein [Myxococcaceae bacterium]
MHSMMGRLIGGLTLALLLGTGCSGPTGPAGATGPDGIDGKDGTAGMVGPTGLIGPTGATGSTGTPGDAGLTGPTGPAGEGYFPLQPGGVVGAVMDASKSAVGSGTIYFVPAAAVAALAATTIGKDSPNDEPLEDLIAANAATYQKATIDAQGRYKLDALTDGSYFVTFKPDAADLGHLPGGTSCRLALTATELRGTRLDIKVSSATPAGATFVGSGVCITCHGRTAISKTMHRLGIWSPYSAGRLQDFSTRKTELHQALDSKFEANGGAGITVYFYDYDSTRGFDKWKTSETDPSPAGVVGFKVTVRQNASGKYEMFLQNVQNPGVGDATYPVDAVYGGGVNKQRYLTKITSGSSFYYATLPLQFNSLGADTALYSRTSKVWRDYHGDWWFTQGTGTFKTPTVGQSFEKNCMSCHAVGTQITVGATDVTASLVSDPLYGDFDYDGDGTKDEVNIGCETCHGPGSEHWSNAGQGRKIVSPSLLTPEREAMICGQCHSRPKGALGTDSPVNAAGEMMIAGTSRNDFLKNYATTQLDGERETDGGVKPGKDFFGDSRNHSKSHHQQYSDFIRSGMYKNDTMLMTCSACHDAHARPNPRQLRFDPTTNAGCAGCHPTQGADLTAHVNAKLPGTGAMHSGNKCVNCHVAKTAKTGAGKPGLSLPNPDGGVNIQYWEDDVSSHIFDVPRKVNSKLGSPGFGMSTPYVSSCTNAACHSAGP